MFSSNLMEDLFVYDSFRHGKGGRYGTLNPRRFSTILRNDRLKKKLKIFVYIHGSICVFIPK